MPNSHPRHLAIAFAVPFAFNGSYACVHTVHIHMFVPPPVCGSIPSFRFTFSLVCVVTSSALFSPLPFPPPAVIPSTCPNGLPGVQDGSVVSWFAPLHGSLSSFCHSQRFSTQLCLHESPLAQQRSRAWSIKLVADDDFMLVLQTCSFDCDCPPPPRATCYAPMTAHRTRRKMARLRDTYLGFPFFDFNNRGSRTRFDPSIVPKHQKGLRGECCLQRVWNCSRSIKCLSRCVPIPATLYQV